jgi:hypothetical protein
VTYKPRYSPRAAKDIDGLRRNPGHARVVEAIEDAVKTLCASPTNRGLRVHPWRGEKCPHDKTLFEAYATQSGAAYRIWFCMCRDGSPDAVVNIIKVGPHP